MSEKLKVAAQQALEAWDDLQSFQKPTTLHQRIEALRAALAEPTGKQPLQVESVAAQHRFRHPQKTMPDWSPWQLCEVRSRPAWEIDSQGYEVEYRNLYTAPPQSCKQEALASMYIALCDAIGYSARSNELQSPEEWVAHLYAKTQKTLTDEEIKVMWDSRRAALPRYLCFARAVERKVRGEKE